VRRQQLVRHHLVHCYMQPRVNGLAVEHHVVITLQRIRKLAMPRLNQQRALILLAPVQQFEVESLVGPVCRGNRPRVLHGCDGPPKLRP
jgi:hypothetical protein